MNIPFISDKRAKSSVGKMRSGTFSVKSKGTQTKSSESFETIFLNIKRENPYMLLNINTLIKQIEEQGKIIISSPTYENFLKYKELISAFLNKVIEVYKIEEELSKKENYQQKVYLVIKIKDKIDEKLTQLAEDILNKQIEAITLLSKINEIKGLLIDIFS